jgi:hypothetical protein
MLKPYNLDSWCFSEVQKSGVPDRDIGADSHTVNHLPTSEECNHTILTVGDSPKSEFRGCQIEISELIHTL